MACSFYTTNGNYWIQLRKHERARYREEKSKFIHALIELLEQKFPGIKDDIEMVDFATPATVFRYTSNWHGSTQGWLPGKNIIASSPVKSTLPNLKQFYYASQWAQPGGGIPIALEQGRNISKVICSDFKIPFKTTKAK